ncbi:hypothetical protein PoB_000651500, partial [Plakobranchus ocellatus]
MGKSRPPRSSDKLLYIQPVHHNVISDLCAHAVRSWTGTTELNSNLQQRGSCR